MGEFSPHESYYPVFRVTLFCIVHRVKNKTRIYEDLKSSNSEYLNLFATSLNTTTAHTMNYLQSNHKKLQENKYYALCLIWKDVLVKHLKLEAFCKELTCIWLK